jgi:hypothetical protein
MMSMKNDVDNQDDDHHEIVNLIAYFLPRLCFSQDFSLHKHHRRDFVVKKKIKEAINE